MYCQAPIWTLVSYTVFIEVWVWNINAFDKKTNGNYTLLQLENINPLIS